MALTIYWLNLAAIGNTWRTRLGQEASREGCPEFLVSWTTLGSNYFKRVGKIQSFIVNKVSTGRLRKVLLRIPYGQEIKAAGSAGGTDYFDVTFLSPPISSLLRMRSINPPMTLKNSGCQAPKNSNSS